MTRTLGSLPVTKKHLVKIMIFSRGILYYDRCVESSSKVQAHISRNACLFDKLCDNPLGFAIGVHVGGINRVDSAIPSGLEEGNRLYEINMNERIERRIR